MPYSNVHGEIATPLGSMLALRSALLALSELTPPVEKVGGGTSSAPFRLPSPVGPS